jgi:outer membrane cobalamin receptor
MVSKKKVTLHLQVSSVRSEEIMSQPSANVGTILAGRVNGAIITSRGGTPGVENPWIFIRGVNFNQQALLVIDGIPRYGGINGGTTGSALLGLNIGDLNPG